MAGLGSGGGRRQGWDETNTVFSMSVWRGGMFRGEAGMLTTHTPLPLPHILPTPYACCAAFCAFPFSVSSVNMLGMLSSVDYGMSWRPTYLHPPSVSSISKGRRMWKRRKGTPPSGCLPINKTLCCVHCNKNKLLCLFPYTHSSPSFPYQALWKNI